MPKRRTVGHFLVSSDSNFLLVKKEDMSSKKRTYGKRIISCSSLYQRHVISRVDCKSMRIILCKRKSFFDLYELSGRVRTGILVFAHGARPPAAVKIGSWNKEVEKP